jgi:hypothetical protein
MGKRGEKRERRSALLEPDAAGIDIGTEELYVAVPLDRDDALSIARIVEISSTSDKSFGVLGESPLILANEILPALNHPNLTVTYGLVNF